jgi:hypothetical protein
MEATPVNTGGVVQMMVAPALMVTDPNGAGTPPFTGRTSAISRSDCYWLMLIWGSGRSRLVVVTCRTPRCWGGEAEAKLP